MAHLRPTSRARPRSWRPRLHRDRKRHPLGGVGVGWPCAPTISCLFQDPLTTSPPHCRCLIDPIKVFLEPEKVNMSVLCPALLPPGPCCAPLSLSLYLSLFHSLFLSIKHFQYLSTCLCVCMCSLPCPSTSSVSVSSFLRHHIAVSHHILTCSSSRNSLTLFS